VDYQELQHLLWNILLLRVAVAAVLIYLEAGGGGGGLLTGILPVATGSAITVTVGAGAAATAKGNNSVFGSITATGGGGAATGNYNGGTSAPTNPLVCNGGSGGVHERLWRVPCRWFWW